MLGGDGNDTVYGGNGGDILDGEGGDDTFKYLTADESPYSAGAPGTPGGYVKGYDANTYKAWTKPWDIIDNFESEEKIDLSLIPLTGGEPPTILVWRGAQGTDAEAGQARSQFAYSVWTEDNGTDPSKFLYADVNGDGKADLKIQVDGVAFKNLIGAQDNDAPVARGDSYSVDEDVTLTADGGSSNPDGVIGKIDTGEELLGDNSDDENDDMDIAAVRVGATEITDGGAGDLDLAEDGSIQFKTAEGGLITIDIETGSFVYDQKGTFDDLDDGDKGSDSFEYKLTDGFLESDWATVGISVNGVTDAAANTAPVARGDSYSVDEDVLLTANGDTNPSGMIGKIDDGEVVDDNDVDGDDMDIAAVKVGITEITDGGTGDLDLIAGNGSIQFETAAGGFVTIDIESGSFVYDQNGAFDNLDDGGTEFGQLRIQADGRLSRERLGHSRPHYKRRQRRSGGAG